MNIAELKQISKRIRSAVLEAADPAKATASALHRTPLGAAKGRLLIIAVGKASRAMAGAALEILGAAVSECLVVLPHGYPSAPLPDPRVQILHAGHPVPDECGAAAARRVAELVQGMGENDRCLFLISGGSSSLLPDPPAGVSLGDMVQTTLLLLKSGAGIRELNTVRKHLSRISGGRLALSCRGTIVTLAISDVVGNDIAVVGSGPTVPDPSTFSNALEALTRFDLVSRVPGSVRTLLEDGAAGRLPETPKALPERHTALIVASSALAVEAASAEARACGFAPIVLTSALTGEAREAGRLLAAVARESRLHDRPVPAPACIIAAGETTVTVRGGGTGGRNQEIALAAAIELQDTPGILLTSFATDGQEGNSDAAGAYASALTLAAGLRAGQDARSCLARNDSFAFLSAAGELIRTGPTGTNVNDITFALVEKSVGEKS
jgi:glycerate 2-kinase